MDAKTRREWVRGWLAVGLREGLTFKEVAERARMKPRTLRRWNARLRNESALRATPEREQQAFVELLERAEVNAPHIELVMPGERPIVIDGAAIVEGLARLLRTVAGC